MPLSRFIILSLCLHLFLSFQNSVAQNGGLRAYTLEDGLPQSQVYDVIQDEIGYLWLGTRGGGICRFDGDEFKIWKESDGLLSNYVNSLSHANDSLYIGTRQGLSIKTKKGFLNLPGNPINKIFQFQNKIYLATNTGIQRYKPGAGVQQLELDKNIDSNTIQDIAFDGKIYWIATTKGLWKLKSLDNQETPAVRHSAYNYTALNFHNNKVFAAAYDRGILVLTINGKSYGNKWIKKPKRVTHLSVHKNELWCATDNEGILIVNPEKRSLTKRINRKNGLVVSHILKTISDRQSNVWIASSGGGFYKFFQNNFTHYDQDAGLKANRIYAVHALGSDIWASNSEQGLVRINSNGIYPLPQIKATRDVKIKTLASDSQGNLWVGTDGKGVILKQFTPENENTNEINEEIGYKTITIDKKRGLLNNWVRSIQIRNDTIWVASYSKGITRFVYDYEKDKVRKIRKFAKRSGIKDLYIRDMKSDGRGRMWYSTRDGDIGFIKGNKVTHYKNILKQKVTINTLLFKNDKLYVGTEGVGIWWSPVDKKLNFNKLTGEKELYSNNIYQMIFDSYDRLWVGTERGVDQVKINLLNQIDDVFHYGRNDGFLGIETCLNAVTEDKEGNLWFGAIYGLTKYEPGETKKITLKPTIFFEDVEVAYKSLDSINLNVWTKNNKVLQLEPEQTELSFSYVTVDLDHPDDLQYRYRLNKTAWSPWSAERRQNLAGLAFGAHSFMVQSRNYRWEKSDPIHFDIFIDSPIYQKLWFQIAVLMVLLLGITGIAYFQIQKVKLKNKEEQEKLQLQNHLLSLEQKALRLQMNPHFIFNVLNGIKAMGTSNPDKMNTTINTFATLLRETLYNSRKDDITLDQEMQTLKHYIEVEKLMASKPFEYSISIDSEFDPEEVLIPPMLIQPFVENAIRHGILKGNKKGILKVMFHTTEEFLYCKIIDNGLGIFQSQKIKTKTDHQSMALTVTRERLESISGEGALRTEELLDEEGIVAGTEIAFKIPLKTDY